MLIFDRTEQPEYTEYMDEDEKHKLTYKVAEGDIHKQREEERRKRQVVERPSYHVDVTTKRTAGHKTEYKIEIEKLADKRNKVYEYLLHFDKLYGEFNDFEKKARCCKRDSYLSFFQGKC